MASAKFAWTDGGAQSLTLQLFLQNQTLAKNVPTFVAVSLDGSVVEAITIGSGQNEAIVTIRHERDASDLRDLLSALRRRISMTLTPDTDSPGTTFTFTAIGAVPEERLEAEGRQNLWAAGPIRLRRLDGGAFDPA